MRLLIINKTGKDFTVMKIIVDSCCDLNRDLIEEFNIDVVPLTIEFGDCIYRDDENLDMDAFLNNMRNTKERIRTSCPSPNDFMEKFKGPDSAFVVTLSSALSGTNRSACIAKKMYFEEFGEKFIHVFDSFSASIGETIIAMKIGEFIKNGYDELGIAEKVDEYIKGMKTFFMLESFDNLVKAGRVNPIVAKITSALSVKPIMAGTAEGTIKLYEKVIGAKRAFKRFVDVIEEQELKLEDRILGISHCNCPEKALQFKEEAQKRYNFKDIVIMETRGISSVYANEGGIVIAF